MIADCLLCHFKTSTQTQENISHECVDLDFVVFVVFGHHFRLCGLALYYHSYSEGKFILVARWRLWHFCGFCSGAHGLFFVVWSSWSVFPSLWPTGCREFGACDVCGNGCYALRNLILRRFQGRAVAIFPRISIPRRLCWVSMTSLWYNLVKNQKTRAFTAPGFSFPRG